jgi:hypothetical protein
VTKGEKLIEVGTRFKAAQGMEFFGIEDVNAAIRDGFQVKAIEKGRPIMSKVGEDAANVKLKIEGFSVLVVLERA